MKRLITLTVVVLLGLGGHCQEAESNLFKKEEPLTLVLTMNVNEVIRDVKKREYHQARLSVLDGSDTVESHDLKVKVRGNNRAKRPICKFPPLRLNFKKKHTKGTLFENQDKLKLVTHCNTKKSNEEYVMREYYAYKVYQLVSPVSFRVRLCHVKYLDEEGDFDPGPHVGFLIEDIDQLAKRQGMVIFKDSIQNQEACTRDQLDKLTFFEYLIGNLDWSIPHRHNIKLVRKDEHSAPVAVPYDFDHAGIVAAAYAKPPPDIDIRSVKERVFRGLCRPIGGYDPTVQFYQKIKPNLYEIYRKAEFLSEKSKEMTLGYLDDFYKILDDPKAVEKYIVKACRANHKHLYQY